MTPATNAEELERVEAAIGQIERVGYALDPNGRRLTHDELPQLVYIAEELRRRL